MKQFIEVLNQIRREASSEQDKGARFECLMQAYLKTAPMYAIIFDEVWLWNEFPYRKELGSHDLGIDLVAKTFTGEYWAIQCKCYAEDTLITKDIVDSFLATSSRRFEDEEGHKIGFAQRLWISTTCNWNENAEETLKNQTPPLVRLNLSDLESSKVDWEKLSNGLFGEECQSSRFVVREHQRQAIEKANVHYKVHDRGKLIMACGTGKTFTALRIAEKETGGSGLVLFLVPSIALLGQTLRAWFDQSEKPIAAVCVCSDAGVSKLAKKRKSDDDNFEEIGLVDLAYPATTDTKKIVRHLLAISEKKKEGMTVVFSTYQSLSVVANAQEELLDITEGKWGVFDFVVCDEAHRTTGVKLTDREESDFVKIHDNDFIQAKKRMYMTATPRIYTESAVVKAKAASAVLCSMDDSKLYGEEFYRIGFGEAVEKQLLTDYKVLVITLSKDDITPEMARIITQDVEYTESDAAKLAGCLSAISKRVIGDEGMLRDVDPQPIRRVVAFCNSIKNSKMTSRLFNDCREVYEEEGGSELMMVEAHHVDGTMSAPRRDRELSWLKETPAKANECRMLTNAKCLSEGVDVPSLDAVLFLSPRDSQVDVVQSVGRVMRTAEGKKYGYIIIPVVVPEEQDADKALDKNIAFKVVWTVLNALRAHDDRFNAEINKIEFGGTRTSRIFITHPMTGEDNSSDGQLDTGEDTEIDAVKAALAHFGEFQKAFYGKLVLKCGDKHYLEDWAKDVAEMSKRRIKRIKEVIKTDEDKRIFFNHLLQQMQLNINPTLTEESFIQMLGQHFVSAPVFESLFENEQFVKSNPVSQVLQAAVKQLADDDMTNDDKEKLDAMRKDVKLKVEGINDAIGRQRVIKELYEKFFSVAAKKATEQLGIVYTPIPVVDFIIHSLGYIVQKEFGRSLSDENVHILDPFTGTGTFITRLLQSGLIRTEDLQRKYEKEIHANEIVLLAYYIASINIETVYHSLMNNGEGEDERAQYKDFQGICLTDTFQLGEAGSSGDIFTEDFEINSQRLIDQRKTPLTVIMGNPPYSAGQKNANDNAQNTHYPLLEKRIADNYVACSTANLRRNLYDSYIKAFRWATDRLGKDGGVIGFVTNGGWLVKNNMDGIRKCFEKDFSAIYVFNLRGDQRSSGEDSRKEGGKIFGSGSRALIAITILVKKAISEGKQKAKIYYYDIGEYLSTKKKLEIISQYHDISHIPWTTIQPDEYGDWINHRSEEFSKLIILGDKKNKKAKTFFVPYYSLGISTNRDAWVYNSCLNTVKDKAREQIDYYNLTLDELDSGQRAKLDFDTNKISWTVGVKSDILERKNRYNFDECSYREVMYRPFFKQHLLYYKPLNERQCQIPQIFPTTMHRNLVICTQATGEKREFSCLMIECTPDLHLIGVCQCFPLYYYDNGVQKGDTLFSQSEGRDEWGYVKRSGLTDYIYNEASHRYGKGVTREDIFYYVYGLLHSPAYRSRFADDLKKSLPRLPLLDNDMFWSFSKAGRELAELHLNYEKVELYSGCTTVYGAYGLAGEKVNYSVKKMRFGKTADNKPDKSVIIFNDNIRIEKIPLEAYDYVVNGQSAIEWIMERYAYNVDSKTGFVNDANDWGREHGDEKYIYNLLLKIITVSLETQKIVARLPNFLGEDE